MSGEEICEICGSKTSKNTFVILKIAESKSKFKCCKECEENLYYCLHREIEILRYRSTIARIV